MPVTNVSISRYAASMTNTAARRLGARVKALREGLRMSQSELARRSFVSRSYISHLETGRNMPSWEVLGHIAETLGVTAYQLIDERPLPATPEQLAIDLMKRGAEALSGLPIQYCGRVPADAPRPVEDISGGATMPVPLEWVGKRSPEDLFVVRASGDCMRSQGIPDGSYVLCEKARGREPRNGQLVAVWVNGERSLKLWYRDGDVIELHDGDGRCVARYTVHDDIVVVGFWVADWRTADDIEPVG